MLDLLQQRMFDQTKKRSPAGTSLCTTDYTAACSTKHTKSYTDEVKNECYTDYEQVFFVIDVAMI
jgi:hypothetical protein